MLCSRCSAAVKPVVALDIDGTLGDYHGHFHNFLDGYVGRKRCSFTPEYNGAIDHSWYCQNSWYITIEVFREAKLAYRQGGLKRTMPAFPDIQVLTTMLAEQGAEVWITTTRPYQRLDNIDPDTREWLSRQEIRFDGLLYHEDKYERLAEAVDPDRVVAVLDDLSPLLRRSGELFGVGVPLLRRTAYNEATSWNGNAVDSIWFASRMIETRIETWKEQHNEVSA